MKKRNIFEKTYLTYDLGEFCFGVGEFFGLKKVENYLKDLDIQKSN